MPAITAIIIAKNEPDEIKKLKFGGLPIIFDKEPKAPDICAFTDDGHELVIERKTPDDLLNTLKDDRLFPQLARMVAKRQEQQRAGEPVTSWAYLVITEPLRCDASGKVITQRGVTGWAFSAVMGMLLSIQEMGVFVVFANGANDYQDCILRIGRRNRKSEMVLLPPRTPNILGPKATFLASLPHVGVEKVQEILAWSGDNLAHALSGLTDLTIKAPLPMSYRKEIKSLFGLDDNQSLEVYQKEM